ncbi:9564_t:CDS:2, partial [Cetraspora pellucida]
SMITMLCVESVNACLKHLLYNLNVSLCELASEIHRLLDIQDRKNEYQFWRLAIPAINQLVYYTSNKIIQKNVEVLNDDNLVISIQDYEVDSSQVALKEMLEFVVVLSKQKWLEELFFVANKFIQETLKQSNNSFCISYLSVFGQDKMNENLTVIDQKIIYKKLYEIYKKALCKTLQSNSKSQQLISLIQEFVDDCDNSDLENEQNKNNKKNIYSIISFLKNLKV